MPKYVSTCAPSAYLKPILIFRPGALERIPGETDEILVASP